MDKNELGEYPTMNFKQFLLNKLQPILTEIFLDSIGQSRSLWQAQKNKAQKNTFRFRRGDFRQCKAYEKWEIQYTNSSYPRPPTPIFDDFDSALEADKGQLILEGNFDVFKSPQNRNKFFEGFLP